MRFRTSYLHSIFDSPLKYRRLIDKIADRMIALKKKNSFGGIAFRGQSGAAMAYPLSAQLNIPLICVRKKGENSHGFSVEGSLRNIKRYVIIDDFIEGGNTIIAIINAIEKEEQWRSKSQKEQLTKCVGIILYSTTQPGEFNREFFVIKNKDLKIPVYYWG